MESGTYGATLLFYFLSGVTEGIEGLPVCEFGTPAVFEADWCSLTCRKEVTGKREAIRSCNVIGWLPAPGLVGLT